MLPAEKTSAVTLPYLEEKFLFNYGHIMDFCKWFEKAIITDQTDSMLELKLEDIESRWRNLKDSYEELMTSTLSEITKDFKEKSRVDFQFASEAYYTAKSQILDLLKLSKGFVPTDTAYQTTVVPHTLHSGPKNSFIQLPPCEIETFTGKYEDWPSFRDLFTTACIANDEIPKAQKLFYLRVKTAGSAGAIVKRYTLCDQNFDHAWNALKSRFENKRVLIDSKLKVLFNIPVATSENSKSLQKIHSTVTDCITALKALDVKVDGWDPILIYLVSTKLPDETLALWEQSFKSQNELPTWSQLDEFLINRYEVVERISSIKTTKQRLSLPCLPSVPRSNIQSYSSQEKLTQTCQLCNGDHPLRTCTKFKKLTVQQRIDYVLQHKICNNCLSAGHLKAKCSSQNRCFICKSDHHTLLHMQHPLQSSTPTNKDDNFNQTKSKPYTESKLQFVDNQPSTSKNSHVQANFSFNNDFILLRTALVQIEYAGELYTVRALIDPGSQRTFLSERVRALLNLRYRKSKVEIVGIGGQVQSANKECTITLCASRFNIKFEVDAIVLPKLSKRIPSISFAPPDSDELTKLDLADPTFNTSSQIDIILGNDSEHFINIDGIKKNVCGRASAYNTIFGWVLSGPTHAHTVHAFTTKVTYNDDSILNDNLRMFWEQEELPQKTITSQEDQYCEEYFKKTTTRDNTGRYIVRLPFRKEFPQYRFLGPSRIMALVQNSKINQSLKNKNPELHKEYNAVLEEYLTLNHMEPTSSREINLNGKYESFYLPHHAVVRPDHKTTKVRIVFNASRKTNSGFSLNDILYTGPTLQSDLITVILNWRIYQYVFSGDIQKMYRQILVHPEDRPYQRIIYQNEDNGPGRDFQLKTVTFGVNCAPFLAIRTLHQLAEDCQDQYPKAVNILRKETYVDDILSGGHTIEEATESQTQLMKALNSAGFNLKKITANDFQLLAHIQTEDLYDSDLLRFHETSSTKTLGIKWNALFDSFSYSFSPIPHAEILTKRKILSGVASIFDPAGWITPIVIKAKVLMQQLWLEGLKWDEEVSTQIAETWNKLLNDFSNINQIRIPRWLQYSPSDKIQIHGFSDASKNAYCATVYLRCQRISQVTFSNLIVAKSKVSPLQPICLPRLELCGALLATKLVKYATETLNLPSCEIFMWTDSSIVIGWLAKPPWSWETYVANRTSQIHSLLPKANWLHVRTHDNPADLGTRGCNSQDLACNLLWWQGPTWLIKPQSEWPKINKPTIPKIEEKIQCLQTAVDRVEVLELFSSYNKALRVLSYVFRYYHNGLRKFRSHFHYKTVTLSQNEVKFVKYRLINLAQKSYYSAEFKEISDSLPLSNKSPLKPLNPFLDSSSVLRVNGRITNASLTYDERYPVILPGNSRFCQLYLEYLHKFLAHAEYNQMCRMVKTEFYVSRLKSHVKKTIRNCKICIIHKQKPCSQIMAPLPQDRCNLTAPFQVSGIDFAGPFDLKSSSLKNASTRKGYVCVLVCFSTKAIHLEPCSDLSTAAFIAAFSRFVGRRGLPFRVYSDNGRNFVGASRQLKREFDSFISSASTEVAKKYISHGFEWIFIPPHAPHMGGLWEAAVKSFKFHLKRITGSYKFSFEEFSAILAQIEGILNSRPISALSEDPADISALTPGHFLRGSPIMSFPTQQEQQIGLLTRWNKLKALQHQFAIQWKEDYLKSLHKRHKWQNATSNLKSGDLVVIMDDLLPPSEWRLGRIEKTYLGCDENVRVADVRTASGLIKRPIVKLCLLPFLNEN